MARTKDEVLIGPGTFYTAPVGEAFPDVDTAVAGNWVDGGYSEDGWAFARDVTVEDAFVAEEIDPLFVLKTAQNLRIVGVFAQASMLNFQLAMGGGTIVNDAGPPNIDTYSPPDSSTFTSKALLLRVSAPTTGVAKVRQFQIPEAVSVGAFELEHNKAPDKSMIAIEYRLVVPSAGNIFDMVDEL